MDQCKCKNDCNKGKESQKELVKEIFIKTIETVDNYIPIIGPFMDIFIIDKIEKELVNVIVDTMYENNMEKYEDFMFFSS